MRATVIIPIWRGAPVIAGCLDAVYRHSGPALHEVICVDNASPDGAGDLVAARFPAARLLRQPVNLGFAGGVNVGIANATGDLFVLVNQDCVPGPGWLDALRAGLGKSLTSHSEQLALTREDFLKVFERAAARLVDGVGKALEQQSSLHREMSGDFELMVRKAADALGAIQRDERSQIDALLRTVNERVTKWLAELKETGEASRDVAIELRRQGETLLQIVAQEEELSRLQGRLTENLEALRSTAELDEAVHGLNAAVHLLTARAKTKAA